MALAFRQFNDRTLHAVGAKPQPPGLASVLHALAERDNCTVNDLIEQTHLPNGTLTGLLDSLERDDCIERVRNPDDGRSRRIRLTKDGRKLRTKLDQRHALVMEIFREALSDAESAELTRLLAQITARMRAYRPGDETSSARATQPRSSPSLQQTPQPLKRKKS